MAIATVLVAASVAFASSGRAGNTAAAAYGGSAPASKVATAGSAGALGVAKGQSNLPFTGLDLTLVVVAGAGLLATGLFVRRRAAARD